MKLTLCHPHGAIYRLQPQPDESVEGDKIDDDDDDDDDEDDDGDDGDEGDDDDRERIERGIDQFATSC